MPRIELPSTDLIIDIPGTMIIGEKECKRKLIVLNLRYSLESKTVVTEGLINFFDLNDVPVSDSLFIRPYGVRMIAANDDYCDLTGTTICKVADAEANPSLLEGKNYMGEFDWFYNVAATVPIVINDMIKAFYLRGIQSGRFD